ncbi:MAG TPA: SIMPL domain-containing protein [Anaerolineae bacterium]|nr:SIMPL domain-containing protein [Anaerolineae bacterium]HMR64095.1 SIMPL domain-containing protein [Anaerolineae bacterium]
MKTKYQALVIAVSAALVLFIGCIGAVMAFMTPATAQAGTLQQSDEASRRITVVGEGTVSAAPDVAQINLGVQVNDPDVKAATKQAEEQIESVIDALLAQGIEESDIQTAYYNVFVDRPYDPTGQVGEPTYQVSNSLQVTVRELDQLTIILGAAIEAGANTVNSVSFNIEDPSELQAQARQDAVTKAKAKAEELATLNEVGLGDVVEVSEVVDQGIFFPAEQALGLGGGGGIVPGEVDVTVRLQITYAILR